jgi:hypothetical protein
VGDDLDYRAKLQDYGQLFALGEQNKGCLINLGQSKQKTMQRLRLHVKPKASHLAMMIGANFTGILTCSAIEDKSS